MIKLNSKQLEALVKLAVSDEPVDYIEFLPDLKPVHDLIGYGFVSEINGFYKIRKKGRNYYNKFLEHASKFFEGKRDSN